MKSITLYIQKIIFEVVLTTIAPLVFPLCVTETMFKAMLKPEVIIFTFIVITMSQVWNVISFFTVSALRDKITAKQNACNHSYSVIINEDAYNLNRGKIIQV